MLLNSKYQKVDSISFTLILIKPNCLRKKFRFTHFTNRMLWIPVNCINILSEGILKNVLLLVCKHLCIKYPLVSNNDFLKPMLVTILDTTYNVLSCFKLHHNYIKMNKFLNSCQLQNQTLISVSRSMTKSELTWHCVIGTNKLM